MIPQETIDSILAAARIEEVISEYVTLKKAGSNYIGLCPFHNEKTPSFVVNPVKNFYNCFGCGNGGNAVKFLMEYKKLSFPEAIKILAKKYNIEVQEKQLSDDEKKARELHEQMIHIHELAGSYYYEQLKKTLAALEYIDSRVHKSEKNICNYIAFRQFQIGFAGGSWDGFYKFAREKGYKEENLVNSTLVKYSKQNKPYDYFRSRIIFPVHNMAGRIVGFGGRTIKNDDNEVKYLNSPENEIFHKGSILYGLFFAREAVIRSRSCNLVEGYLDVICMHAAGIENTVAANGTALTTDQAGIIHRYTKNITMVYDGDNAGLRAAEKNGKILLDEGLNVSLCLLPEKEDPASFFSIKTQFDNYEKQDYILWMADRLVPGSANDPQKKHFAIKEISSLLHCLKSETLVNTYISDITAKYKGLQKKQFQDELKLMEAGNEKPVLEHKLPKTVDADEFEKWGFYEFKNEYWFRTKDGITKFSNFIMKPLFHVESVVDTRRIYELINYKGFRVVVDFDMQEMTSLSNFRRNIEGKGNYLFWGGEIQMNKLKLKLYEETRTCYEIRNLGWQKEGFWAWSNGIYTDDGFIPVDDNGLVKFNNRYYFIPAFSKIYIDDKSVFLDERKFRNIDRDVDLKSWSKLFIEVFGDNARIAIAFYTAALFRDYILHIFKNFPILNLFGPKGTGKSQMAMSMSCLFGLQQTPFNIHNGTKPGLAEHVQQFVNSLAWIDEYKNNIDYDKIETLKSIYDAIGRNRLAFDKSKKKETTQVNSAVILSGQEMATADVALFSRMIFLQFHQTEFSKEEKKKYDQLKAMETDGLSKLTNHILAHRKYFEKNYYREYEEVLADLFNILEKNNIEDRIMRSMCAVIASYKCLEEKLDISMNYKELRRVAVKSVKDQNKQISKSNEVSMFWELIEAMFDENILIDRWHFKIDVADSLKLYNKTRSFKSTVSILKLKFSSVYKLYAEHAKRSGQGYLPNTTLRYYLENSKYYLGTENSSRFILKEFSRNEGKIIEQKQVTTAYCFDYEKLDINLVRTAVEQMVPVNNEQYIPDQYTESGKENYEPAINFPKKKDDILPF